MFWVKLLLSQIIELLQNFTLIMIRPYLRLSFGESHTSAYLPWFKEVFYTLWLRYDSNDFGGFFLLKVTMEVLLLLPWLKLRPYLSIPWTFPCLCVCPWLLLKKWNPIGIDSCWQAKQRIKLPNAFPKIVSTLTSSLTRTASSIIILQEVHTANVQKTDLE